ncbi:sialate O-acetylesterase [Sphingomonas sp. KC8]|uniref:sialate O-acetylesterase n=1 Tax=Sphingomonas sp. KC8 TaxID=1030157 RepID=UPI000307DDB8|nr:sialate O-acetylesterase [Sphingomonas sp. KC8]ARS28676.1 hypothetical protein KC8_15450 [Sphingomonas sp. KC8]
MIMLAGAVLLVAAGWMASGRNEGRVQYGATQSHTPDAGHSALPCPANAAVVVLFGQSLAANSGAFVYPAAGRGGGLTSTYIFHGGHCYPLGDPMPGATGKGGSVGPPLALLASTALDRPVVMIAGAVSGSSILQWTPADSPFARALLDRLAQARRAGLAPSVYIWMQGEADTGSNMTATRYADELRALHSRFPPAPWIVTANSICTYRPVRSPMLDRARASFAAITPDVHLDVDMDSLGMSYRQADRCHLNAAGQQEAARRLATAVVSVLGRPGS